MLRLLFALLLASLLAGCSSRSAAPDITPRSLPPLPETAELSGPHPPDRPLRTGATPAEVILPGQSPFDASPDAQPQADGLLIAPAGGQLGWAIYELTDVSAQYYPTTLRTEVSGLTGEYWLALADYSQQRWQFILLPQTGNLDMPLFNWQDYVSPGGSFFFVVCLSGSTMEFNRGIVTVEEAPSLPAPTGLAALPASSTASLTWDPYPDARASEIRVYQSENSDMAAATLAVTVPATGTYAEVTDLVYGTEYFFALKAFSSSESVESAYGGIVSCSPYPGPPAEVYMAEGTWPRLGNREDGRGNTELLGPAALDTVVSASLSDDATRGANRTSPIIGEDGSVYALSRDGKLHCFTADLASERWTFDAADHGDADVTYVCPPHAPCIDYLGAVYFVAVPLADELTRTGYLFCVRRNGSFGWKFSLSDLADDNAKPYPSLNFTANGALLAAGASNRILYAVDRLGGEAWNHDFNPSIEFYADPVWGSNNDVELPVWFSGIGMDMLTHWVSLSSSTGELYNQYQDFGGPANLYGGLSLPVGFFIYPETSNLKFLDAGNGTLLASAPLGEIATSSPACTTDYEHVFQLVPPNEMPPSYAHLKAFTHSHEFEPGELTEVLNLQLETARLFCKPAVDGDDNLYFADVRGRVFRVHFDARTPRNSSITHSRKLGDTDTYYFNSVALGNGVAYVVTEQNLLYRIGAPR